MRRAALLVLVACGDNALPDGVPLVPTRELVVVAHQDDDLLFMQPDVVEAVQRGDGVTSVYVTAGNGTKGVDYAETRYDGLKSAYGAAAGRTDWTCGWIDLVGHAAEHCRLAGANVSLVFVGYPDGGKLGEQPSSLLHLWEGLIDGADTVARRSAHYTQDGLVDAVAEVMRATQPRVVRTLDVASTHGRDHIDHMIVGALALLAVARADSRAEIVSYRGYDIADEPVDKIDPTFAAVFPILAHYEACVAGCAPCGDACTTIDPTHVTWLRRRYAVGFRRTAGGVLQSGTQCLAATSSASVALVDCATAPPWTLDDYGQLHVDTRCLEALPTGELVVGDCAGGPPRRFFLDDEGHVWSGQVPFAATAMDYKHLWCLTPTAGRARAELCGQDAAPTWQLVPPTTTMPRATLGLTATGRAVRLADLDGDGKADLCSLEPGGLLCAIGDGTGGFATATRIDRPGAPLVIDPTSLAIGDVDGDGRPDACGRDAGGIVCAIAATGFGTQRISTTFGDADALPGTPASLTIVDGAVCGLASEGVACVSSSTTVIGDAPADQVWPGDLDGDGNPDWCTSASGASCAVSAEAAITRAAAPWAFALGGMFEATAPDPNVTALADVDGDGRADLCALDGDRVACARSQGRGFGPKTTLAVLPGGTALWLGDLDGDGKADACVDAGGSIDCALSR